MDAAGAGGDRRVKESAVVNAGGGGFVESLDDEPDEPVALDPARQHAYIRAFRLIVAVQSAEPGAADAIAELLAEATEHGWPEVVRAASFAQIVATGTAQEASPLPSVQRLLEMAEVDEAPAMVALALALRASRRSVEADPELALTADDDLARATVLLETGDGPPLERISAHNSCATAYSERWLWELADEQYAGAMALAPSPSAGSIDLVLPAIVYNRAEMQVNWACVHRQLDDRDGLDERWRTWQAIMTVAGTVHMPELWAVELDALGAVLKAVLGMDVATDAQRQLQAIRSERHPGAWPVGWLHLAMALSHQGAGRHADALADARRAVDEIDQRGSADCHDLALALVAQLESSDESRGALRYARRQLTLRWANRMAALGSMRGRLQAERLRRDHEVLSRQAHRDDLTGLLNRRGFSRYLEAAERHQVQCVALLIADLDNFKSVNDRHGHGIGDAALITVGHLLEGNVRTADCAVRLGGDEFAVVLSGAELEVARRRAEALVVAVRTQPWHDLAPGLTLSISVGLATGKLSEFPQLLERADAALYEAKAVARGGVVWHDPGSSGHTLPPLQASPAVTSSPPPAAI